MVGASFRLAEECETYSRLISSRLINPRLLYGFYIRTVYKMNSEAFIWKGVLWESITSVLSNRKQT
jgi:hypothetical protein